ncbi:MAG: hypothetical protein Q9171_007323 [Xanthocarpia ochracea]
MEEQPLQVHVLSSLYSFSGDAREQLLSKFREKATSINFHCEWHNEKYLRISSNDEGFITACLNVYQHYTGNEKNKAQVPYEVLKLERSSKTLTRRAKLEMPAEKKDSELMDVYNVKESSQILVAHETVSKIWSVHPDLIRSTPKRLLSPKVLEKIAVQANCRISYKVETGAVTVKGDNDQDINETIKSLDNLAQGLSLRQNAPQIFNFVNPEVETDIWFRLTSLGDHEANDHRSTTYIDQDLLHGSQPPNLAVILLVTIDGAILTRSRLSDARYPALLPHIEGSWTHASILPYGDQGKDLTAIDSAQSNILLTLQPITAPRSIAEWVATVSHKGEDPPKPLDQTEDANDVLPPSLLKRSTLPPDSWVDGLEAAENENIDTTQLKKRFGRNRKKPSLDGIAEIDYEKEINNCSLHSPSKAPPSSGEGKSSSGLIPHLEIPVPELSTKLASTLSTTITVSHSGSQKSPVADASSSTPSTQISHQDLLTSAEATLVYPVMTPIIVKNGRETGPQATEFSIDSQSQAVQPSAWVRRNVTSRAENQRPRLLINCVDAETRSDQSTSYLAAAKRGASVSVRPRGSFNGRVKTTDSLSLPHKLPASGTFENQSHVASYESVECAAPKTTTKAREARSKPFKPPIQQTVGRILHKDNAKRSTTSTNSLQPENPAAVQLLQLANGLGGIVTMGIEIGRILVKTDSIQPSKSTRWTNVYNAWSSIFDSGDGSGTETIFTNRVLLEVTQSGSAQVLSTEHVVGAVQLHFPKRQWDARLAVKTSEQIHDYEDAVRAVSTSLSVVPNSDQTTASLFADLGDCGLIFKSASVVRAVHFRCLTDPDITMTCREVQHLGLARERQRFYNSHIDRAAAETGGNLWWEVELESINTTKRLQQDASLPFGVASNWTPEDIIQGGTVERLHAIATQVVTQIDGIGARLKQAVTEVSSKTLTESWEPPKGSASVADTFW